MVLTLKQTHTRVQQNTEPRVKNKQTDITG